jgi:hypothetical protein
MVEPKIDCLTEDAAGIHYAEPKAPLAVVVCTVLCLTFLTVAALMFFARLSQPVPEKNGVAGGILPLLLMLSAFTGFGAYILHAPQHLKFDRTTRRLTGRSWRGALVSSDVDVGFDQLGHPTVHRSQLDTVGDLFEIRLIHAERREFTLGASEYSDEVDAWRNRVTVEAWAKRIDDLIASRPVI